MSTSIMAACVKLSYFFFSPDEEEARKITEAQIILQERQIPTEAVLNVPRSEELYRMTVQPHPPEFIKPLTPVVEVLPGETAR